MAYPASVPLPLHGAALSCSPACNPLPALPDAAALRRSDPRGNSPWRGASSSSASMRWCRPFRLMAQLPSQLQLTFLFLPCRSTHAADLNTHGAFLCSASLVIWLCKMALTMATARCSFRTAAAQLLDSTPSASSFPHGSSLTSSFPMASPLLQLPRCSTDAQGNAPNKPAQPASWLHTQCCTGKR